MNCLNPSVENRSQNDFVPEAGGTSMCDPQVLLVAENHCDGASSHSVNSLAPIVISQTGRVGTLGLGKQATLLI